MPSLAPSPSYALLSSVFLAARSRVLAELVSPAAKSEVLAFFPLTQEGVQYSISTSKHRGSNGGTGGGVLRYVPRRPGEYTLRVGRTRVPQRVLAQMTFHREARRQASPAPARSHPDVIERPPIQYAVVVQTANACLLLIERPQRMYRSGSVGQPRAVRGENVVQQRTHQPCP